MTSQFFPIEKIDSKTKLDGCYSTTDIKNYPSGRRPLSREDFALSRKLTKSKTSTKFWCSLTLKLMIDDQMVMSTESQEDIYRYILSTYMSFNQGMVYVRDYVFEKDSKEKIHLHALIALDKIFRDFNGRAWQERYEAFHRFLHVHAKIDHAGTPENWIAYMHKNEVIGRWSSLGHSYSPKQAKLHYDNGLQCYFLAIKWHKEREDAKMSQLLLDCAPHTLYSPM